MVTIGASALARLCFLGRAFLSSATLITYLVPPSILFIPLYAQIRTMGLADSLAGLIAAYPSFTVPFVTWLLMGYFGSIPEELEEAAMIDGATRFRAFRQIILPLTLPGIAATLGFVFTAAWSELLFALMLARVTVTSRCVRGIDSFGLHKTNLAALSDCLRRVGVPGCIALSDGFAVPPDRPGNGLAWNPKAVERYRM